MAEMRADVAAHSASAGRILTVADELQGLLGQLQAEADATAAIWAGDSHVSFLGGTAQIHAELQKGQALTAEISNKVSHTGTNYGSTETQNAGALSQTGL
jgi:WXG100 family type VII secretion target